jgi:FKBP-type peptidyl-prolyl cis-trans isomerase 2
VNKAKIADGARVTVRYRLYDRAGELLETSEEGEPMEYVQGSGEVAPGIEAALTGKEVGDRVQVTLPPEEAFGVFDAGLIVSVPRAEIPAGVPLSVGEYLPVQLEDAPADLAEEEVEFRIVEVGEDEVVLDANHPLAGETVTFELEVLSVSA